MGQEKDCKVGGLCGDLISRFLSPVVVIIEDCPHWQTATSLIEMKTIHTDIKEVENIDDAEIRSRHFLKG